MAVTEDWPSRGMHITSEGTTITQIYTCSDDDINAGGDGTTALPILGKAWSPYREDLRVTDIRYWWLNNKNARVEILYSTVGLSYPRHLPDKLSSVKPIFDFDYTPITLAEGDTYWDYVAGESKEWTIAYQAVYPGKPIPSVPAVFPHISMTEKMNLTTWDWNDIESKIGKVNEKDFIAAWESERRGRKVSWIDITGDDTGKWLFAGFHCEELGYQNYEVALVFLYDGVLWNKPYGVTTNMYEVTDFSGLPYPNNPDDTVNDGLR